MRNLKIVNINAKPYGESRFFTKEIKEIINILKNLTPYDIQSLTKINEKIGFQSYAYFQEINFKDKGVCGQNL